MCGQRSDQAGHICVPLLHRRGDGTTLTASAYPPHADMGPHRLGDEGPLHGCRAGSALPWGLSPPAGRRESTRPAGEHMSPGGSRRCKCLSTARDGRSMSRTRSPRPAHPRMRVLEASEPSTSSARSRTVITTPAPAGSGASVLAAALAMRAQARAQRCILIDVDPASGGVDLLVGAERIPGARWPDLAHVRDPLPAGSLAPLLPAVPDAPAVRVLSMTRTPSTVSMPDPAVMRAVLTSAQRESDLVIIDAPTPCHGMTSIPWLDADAILLVTGGSVRAFAAAQSAVAALPRVQGRIGLVVRAPGPRRDHDALALADALTVPLVAEVMHEQHLDRQIDDAMPPGSHPRSPVARTADALLSHLMTSVPTSSALRGRRSA